MPTANRLTVGIMAMVADDHRCMISKRTKEALAAAKKRGKKVGGFREGAKLTRTAREAGSAAVAAIAAAKAARSRPHHCGAAKSRRNVATRHRCWAQRTWYPYGAGSWSLVRYASGPRPGSA
jgi:DNA invertase Pin-like site-specific DNA recombinase